MTRLALSGALAGLLASVAAAAPLTASWTSPDLDSYTYPLVGQRSNASEPLFGAYNIDGFVGAFDNRDAQIQIAFDTGANGVPTGLALTSYRVRSVTMTVTIATTTPTVPPYDPTQDPVGTYQLFNGPPADPDPDAGRPITLFGAAFRNGYTGFEFGPAPAAGPPLFGESGEGYGPAAFGQNIRHVYPTDARLDEVGPGVFELRDVSTNLDEPNFGAGAFDPVPFAVGEMTARTSAVPIAPGVDIEAGDEFTFEIALCDGAINTYVREALRDGQIGFVLASLHPAVGGPGGGFDGSYPFFHFSEGAGPPATLEIVFDVVGVTTCLGDLDGDGSTLLGDFSIFSSFFGQSVCAGTSGDFNGDGEVTLADFGLFASDFGCEAP